MVLNSWITFRLAPSLTLEFRAAVQAGGRKNGKRRGRLVSLAASKFYWLKIQPEAELDVTAKIAYHKVVYNNKHNYEFVSRHLFPIGKVNNDKQRRILIENGKISKYCTTIPNYS